jgi:hypothetical protein
VRRWPWLRPPGMREVRLAMLTGAAWRWSAAAGRELRMIMHRSERYRLVNSKWLDLVL